MKYTQIRKISKGKKIAIIAGAILVLGLAAGGFFYVQAQQKPATKTTTQAPVNYGSATQDQVTNGATIKSNSATSTTGTPNTSGSDQPLGDASVTITSANQSGGVLTIRTLIAADVSTGTCTLTLEKSGETTITQTAGVQAEASSSTCKGFTVETVGLAKGDWTTTITYQNDTLKGSASQTITIQ